MSKKQSSGPKKYDGPRYASGDRVPLAELDMIAQAFGFTSARHFDAVLAHEEPSNLGSMAQLRQEKERLRGLAS